MVSDPSGHWVGIPFETLTQLELGPSLTTLVPHSYSSDHARALHTHAHAYTLTRRVVAIA